jgi:hypothetical protein
MAQQINLFSPLFLRKRKYFSAVTMVQALGLLLGGVLLFYGYAVYETRKLQRIVADSSAQLKAQSDAVAKIAREFSPQGRSRTLEDEAARLGVRLKQREDVLAQLRTGLGNTEGFARYLAAFARQTTPGVWITAITLGGDESELALFGRAVHADLVPGYLKVLNKEEVMRGRRIGQLRLTAREEAPLAATATPGANPVGAPKPPAAAQRYVEFEIKALRVAAPAGVPPEKAK